MSRTEELPGIDHADHHQRKWPAESADRDPRRPRVFTAGLIISLTLREQPTIRCRLAACQAGGFQYGTMNMNRWIAAAGRHSPGPGLKGFDDRYRLTTGCPPHVLLGPTGLYVLTALGQDGAITYDGARFQQFSGPRPALYGRRGHRPALEEATARWRA